MFLRRGQQKHETQTLNPNLLIIFRESELREYTRLEVRVYTRLGELFQAWVRVYTRLGCSVIRLGGIHQARELVPGWG